jgi:hypothetical protein
VAAARLLEEHPDLTIEEAALAASCLVALPCARYREAAPTLKAMAETATRRNTGTRRSVNPGRVALQRDGVRLAVPPSV